MILYSTAKVQSTAIWPAGLLAATSWFMWWPQVNTCRLLEVHTCAYARTHTHKVQFGFWSVWAKPCLITTIAGLGCRTLQRTRPTIPLAKKLTTNRALSSFPRSHLFTSPLTKRLAKFVICVLRLLRTLCWLVPIVGKYICVVRVTHLTRPVSSNQSIFWNAPFSHATNLSSQTKPNCFFDYTSDLITHSQFLINRTAIRWPEKKSHLKAWIHELCSLPRTS